MKYFAEFKEFSQFETDFLKTSIAKFSRVGKLETDLLKQALLGSS